MDKTVVTNGNFPGGNVELARVSNSQFVNMIYSSPPDSIANLAICNIAGDPTEVRGWHARTATSCIQRITANTNNYINCSAFSTDAAGEFKVRKENFVACVFFMLDDIGTKVSLEALGTFKLTWLIETSPGNFQGGILFKEPITDSALVNRIHKAIIKKGLCDEGATGVATRWARLPVGINGKSKYRSTDGAPFRCRLVQFDPKVRYSIEEIIEGLNLNLDDPTPEALPTPCDHTQREPAANTQGTANGGAIEDTYSDSQIEYLLSFIDPDRGYQEWTNALMAVFRATRGSESGLALSIAWSSEGKKYAGKDVITEKWKSFRADVAHPITIATLIKAAREAKGFDEARLYFDECDMEEVIMDKARATNVAPATRTQSAKVPLNPLQKFSITNKVAELEKQMVEQIPLLGNIALLGQATVIYAWQNTGKTIIVMHLLMEAIRAGRVDPSLVYYLNMDDNGSGLVEKARIAEEFEFHMLSAGQSKFKAKYLLDSMEEMIKDRTARGVVIILDTLKKFTDTMDKTKSAAFADLVRQFVLMGGTVIALAHANKKPDTDGKPIYAGTTDIIDDFDCGYRLYPVLEKSNNHVHMVEFENIKARGNVAKLALFSFSAEDGVSYNERLASVQLMNPEDLLDMQLEAEKNIDTPAIEAIRSCIQQGVNTKMELGKVAAEKIKVSRKALIKVLEKYTGADPNVHLWTFTRGERGALRFALHPAPAAPASVPPQQS